VTTLRICFVGDSLVLGTNDHDFQGWPGRIAHREVQAGHDVSVYNLGIRADTSEMIASRWRSECEARLPDVHPGALVFSFGTNDMAEENDSIRVPLKKSCAIARKMMSEARAWKPVLWVGLPPVDDGRQPFRAGSVTYDFSSDRSAQLNDAYAELARELDIPYLDLFTILSSDANWLDAFSGEDGVHPLHSGYAQMAERITGWDAWRAWFD